MRLALLEVWLRVLGPLCPCRWSAVQLVSSMQSAMSACSPVRANAARWRKLVSYEYVREHIFASVTRNGYLASALALDTVLACMDLPHCSMLYSLHDATIAGHKQLAVGPQIQFGVCASCLQHSASRGTGGAQDWFCAARQSATRCRSCHLGALAAIHPAKNSQVL